MVAARPVYPRLSLEEQGELLERIVARCARGAEAPPVVVFDLDGTLIDNRPRTCSILHEIADLWRVRAPHIAARLRSAESQQLAYHFQDSLELLGVTRGDLVEEATLRWRTRFFADGALEHDVEVPGARAYARACYEAGASLLYFTGRDLPLMGVGTFASLRDLGFPIAVPGTELVLKPDASVPDSVFKRALAPRLGRVGSVVATFDNEPENCNVLLAEFPTAETVFVDTQHVSGAPPLDPRVKIISHFSRAGARR